MYIWEEWRWRFKEKETGFVRKTTKIEYSLTLCEERGCDIWEIWVSRERIWKLGCDIWGKRVDGRVFSASNARGSAGT